MSTVREYSHDEIEEEFLIFEISNRQRLRRCDDEIDEILTIAKFRDERLTFSKLSLSSFFVRVVL